MKGIFLTYKDREFTILKVSAVMLQSSTAEVYEKPLLHEINIQEEKG